MRTDGEQIVDQKVQKISKEEVRLALKRMKSGKAVGPDDIPMEVWKCSRERERTVDFCQECLAQFGRARGSLKSGEGVSWY